MSLGVARVVALGLAGGRRRLLLERVDRRTLGLDVAGLDVASSAALLGGEQLDVAGCGVGARRRGVRRTAEGRKGWEGWEGGEGGGRKAERVGGDETRCMSRWRGSLLADGRQIADF